MLNNIFGAMASASKDLYEITGDMVNYVVDDIKSIPDSIEKGWDKGLFTSSDDQTTITEELSPAEQNTLPVGENKNEKPSKLFDQ